MTLKFFAVMFGIFAISSTTTLLAVRVYDLQREIRDQLSCLNLVQMEKMK